MTVINSRGPYRHREEYFRRYEERYKSSSTGALFHVYNRGVGRRAIFGDVRDRQFYLKRLAKGQKNGEVTILAYCLMPNHVHLLVRQETEKPISRFISSLHTSYAKNFNIKYRHVGHLFQRRFRQVLVRGESQLRYLIAYIHLNPIEAGLTSKPEDYSWSSHLAYATRHPDFSCNAAQGLEFFDDKKEYRVFLESILQQKKSARWDKITHTCID